MKNFKKVLVLSIAVLFVFASCKKGSSDSPESVVKGMVEMAKAKNWGGIHDSLTKESTKKIEEMLKGIIAMVSSMAKTNPDALKDPKTAKLIELANLTGKEFFVKLIEIEPDKASSQFVGMDIQILKTDIQGDKATVTVKSKEKAEEQIQLIKEDGKWKIDITSKLGAQ